MSRAVLPPLGRSGVEEELYMVVGVEGKEEKCKLEKAVVVAVVEEEVVVVEEEEVVEVGCE